MVHFHKLNITFLIMVIRTVHTPFHFPPLNIFLVDSLTLPLEKKARTPFSTAITIQLKLTHNKNI
uniref:Uncharacterized protein n=1 Tax=Anguilla anguilla TaxID=7936 RepID=A0A0E9RTB5_ANGAN